MGSFQRDRITIIAKVTRRCNFACSYCYDCDTSEAPETLHSLPISQAVDLMALASRSYGKVSMIWHGGEPLLMGLDYYRSVIEAQRSIESETGCEFRNAVQTNGHLLDNDSAAELVKMGYRVGLSYDGLRQQERRGHADSLEQAIASLGEAQESVGAICVVTADDLDLLRDQYEHFNDRRVGLQLNPFFESARSLESGLEPVRLEDYLQAMKELCTHWLRDPDCRITLNPPSAYVGMLFGQRDGFCEHNSCLGRYLSVMPDGTLYPCGRPLPKRYSMDHFSSYEQLHDAFSSAEFLGLLESAVERRRVCLETCSVYRFCKGGCSQQAVSTGQPDTPGGLTCDFLRGFLPWLADELRAITKDGGSVNPRVARIISRSEMASS